MFTLTNIVIGQTVALPSSIQRVSERRTWETRGRGLKLTVQNYLHLAVAYLWGGGWGVQPPPPHEILKVLQNRAKLNPIVRTVKNC
jgi:hypothetical protein